MSSISIILLLLGSVCLGLAERASIEGGHHPHRRHHRHHEHALHPSFSHKAHHGRRAWQDICYSVKQGAFLLADACGAGNPTDLPLGTILTSTAPVTNQVSPCDNQKCQDLGVDCSTWLQVAIRGENSGGLQQGFVPEALVDLGSCGDSASAGTPATPATSATTTATTVQPASALVSSLTLTANNPVDYPPLLPVSGDGICYYTPPYRPDGAGVIEHAFTMRDSPCGSTIVARVPPSTELTPLYASQYVATCTQASKTTCAQQRKAYVATHTDASGFDCSKPFTYFWWIQVQYGTVTGWIPNGTIMKRRCGEATLPVAPCTLTPNTPHKCYRSSSRIALRDAPCGAITVTAPVETIFVSTDDQPAQPCPSDATKSSFHVTFNGQDGYILAQPGLTTFDCNGDGFLTTVGPYTVLRIDHTHGDHTSPHCPPGRSCARQQQTPSKFLLHTTDGRWPNWGDYPSPTLDSHAYWPHFLLARNASGFITVAQYFSMYSNSRALESNGGNEQGVVQVEIGARGEIPFTENDQELTVAVRALYEAISSYTGIPICRDSRVLFIAGFGGASSYHGVQRLSRTVFGQVNGLVGHSTPHNNSHWDPGVIDPYKLIL